MDVKLAKSAGFCFGVKRAVDTVYEQIALNDQKTPEEQTPIYTYGPIIHNEEVIADLERKGVRIVNNEEELVELTEGTVIIRSHGVGEKIYNLIEKQNLKLEDATCPFVKRIHNIVEKESTAGKKVIVLPFVNDENINACGSKPFLTAVWTDGRFTPLIIFVSPERP